MSKRTKCLFMVFAILLVVNLFIAGCEVVDNGEIRFCMSPKTADSIEKGGEDTLSLLTILAPLLGPVGGILVGATATGLTVFKKVKPKLVRVI